MESPQPYPGPEWLARKALDDTLAKCALVIITREGVEGEQVLDKAKAEGKVAYRLGIAKRRGPAGGNMCEC